MRKYCKDPMQKNMDALTVEIVVARQCYSDRGGDGHRPGYRILLAKMTIYGPFERELLIFMGDRKKRFVNFWLLRDFSQFLVSIMMSRR